MLPLFACLNHIHWLDITAWSFTYTSTLILLQPIVQFVSSLPRSAWPLRTRACALPWLLLKNISFRPTRNFTTHPHLPVIYIPTLHLSATGIQIQIALSKQGNHPTERFFCKPTQILSIGLSSRSRFEPPETIRAFYNIGAWKAASYSSLHWNHTLQAPQTMLTILPWIQALLVSYLASTNFLIMECRAILRERVEARGTNPSAMNLISRQPG